MRLRHLYYQVSGMMCFPLKRMIMQYIFCTYTCCKGCPLLLSRIIKVCLGIFPAILIILYGLFHYTVQHLLPTTLSFQIFFYTIGSLMWISLFFLMISRPAKILKDKKLEKYLAHHRPETQKNICDRCKMVKIIRSFHCYHCDQCFAKWQEHSFCFNLCIDANTQVLYLLHQIFAAIFLGIIIGLSFPRIFAKEKGSILAFIISVLYLMHVLPEVIRHSHSLLSNITVYEESSCRYIPYLWGNEQKAFGNPFDRGYMNNIIQGVIPLPSAFGCPPQIEPLLANKENIELSNISIENKEKESDGLMERGSGDGNISQHPREEFYTRIRAYRGDCNPNWYSLRIYNLIDIHNSGVRESMLRDYKKKILDKRAKKELRRKERKEKLQRNELEKILIPGSEGIHMGDVGSGSVPTPPQDSATVGEVSVNVLNKPLTSTEKFEMKLEGTEDEISIDIQ